MKRAVFFGPFIGFVALAAILYAGFHLNDPTHLPSALIGQPFPRFQLPELTSGKVLGQQTLLGETRLVNVWATWCPTCLHEHTVLMSIAGATGLSIVGINYRDDSAKARRWLSVYGDPYDFTIVDATGDLGIELGVYGAPETFIVDADGIIRFRHVGDVNDRNWNRELLPILDSLTDG
ncbi:MAG: DsbE family thiol:disulfide interchange protein [Pseudomonadales bacterium]